jgi:hypothetical protein
LAQRSLRVVDSVGLARLRPQAADLVLRRQAGLGRSLRQARLVEDLAPLVVSAPQNHWAEALAEDLAPLLVLSAQSQRQRALVALVLRRPVLMGLLVSRDMRTR